MAKTLPFVLIGVFLLWVLVPNGSQLEAQSPDKAQPVYVVNQPQTVTVQGQVTLAGPIEGEVSVRGPIPQGRTIVFSDVEVAPVQKTEISRLVRAGTLATEGFVNMVVSLAGMQRSTPTRAGEVGLVLIPEEELPLRALEEFGQWLFALEAKAKSTPQAAPYFASEPLRATVAFPRYRVLLYNTSDRTVSVTVYAYLTS